MWLGTMSATIPIPCRRAAATRARRASSPPISGSTWVKSNAVVAVDGAAARGEDRGEVEVADAERGEVRHGRRSAASKGNSRRSCRRYVARGMRGAIGVSVVIAYASLSSAVFQRAFGRARRPPPRFRFAERAFGAPHPSRRYAPIHLSPTGKEISAAGVRRRASPSGDGRRGRRGPRAEAVYANSGARRGFREGWAGRPGRAGPPPV